MNRSELNTSSRRYEENAQNDNSSMYTDRIVVESRATYTFVVSDKRTEDFVEVQLLPFGRRCMIRFNDLGWFDLVKIAKFTKATPHTMRCISADESSYDEVRSIVVECDHHDDLEISYCSQEMFGHILEQLAPFVEKYVDNYQDDITAVYDQYRRPLPFCAPMYRPFPQPPSCQPLQHSAPQATQAPQASQASQVLQSRPRSDIMDSRDVGDVRDVPRKKKGELWRFGKSKSTLM